MFALKVFVWLAVGIAAVGYAEYYEAGTVVEQRRDVALRQLDNDDTVPAEIRRDYITRKGIYALGGGLWMLMGILFFFPSKKHVVVASFVFLNVGCYRPVEPVKIEFIGNTEEGFLIPLTGDTKKQVSTSSEQFLKENLVLTKQVRVPQQWIQTGRQYWYGHWQDSAVLLKVDRSPVTREWTADPTSGTSTKNEAIWVMTADQVEFSTGWGITASINGRDNAVKFLYNYPNGVLSKVLDTEVRSKLQTTFGLEVTDLPMEKLRIAATPHVKNTVDTVIAYFADRGITIMNLGITGGFVYKNKTIEEKIVEVFNSEQQANIAKAATQAQIETNKKIQLEAEAKSQALLTERKAEAEGILAVAEARKKEVSVVTDKPEVYLSLRRIELEKEKLQRWNGSFPTFFMSGDKGTPDFLLNVPAFDTKVNHRQ